MSEPQKTDQEIINAIISNPNGEEVIKTASEITDIVFGIRACSIFNSFIDTKEIEGSISNKLNLLLQNFRQLAGAIVGSTLPENNEELYTRIIYPIIERQLDTSS